jgi:hypothetical protein
MTERRDRDGVTAKKLKTLRGGAQRKQSKTCFGD